MKFFNFLKSEQKTVGKATLVISFFMILSRFFGLIRDRLLASTFGPSVELDIYFAAFRIPDLIFSVVLAGGVLVSLLPLFSDYYKKDKDEAWKLINSVINIFVIALLVFSVLLFIFTPELVALLLPGLAFEYIGQTVILVRLLFTGVFFLGLSSIFSTVINYFDRFVVYSLAPILYNICIILGIIFLAPTLGNLGPAIGVVVGAFFHFLIQFLPTLKYGFKYRPIIDLNFKGVKDFFKLLFPRIISAAASQVNLLVVIAIASTIAVGSISFFTLADNLRNLPLGFIGVAFATAVFPHLSKAITDKRMEDFSLQLRKVFQAIIYLALPITILTFIMRDLIVNIILGTGQFTGYAVEITGACLGIFALSLIFQCLEPTILRAYFSIKDTKTPAIISLAFLVVNFILSLSFVELLKQNQTLNSFVLNLFNLESSEQVLLLGLVFAYNVSLILDFVLLFSFLKKKIGDFDFKKMRDSFLKISLSSVPMVLITLLVIKVFPAINDFWMNLLEFTVVTLIAFFVYYLFTLLFKTEEAKRIKEVVLKTLR